MSLISERWQFTCLFQAAELRRLRCDDVALGELRDPNAPGLPEWPAFDAKGISTMTFGKILKAGAMPNREKVEAFDAYFAQSQERQ